jgi:RimJ/RimL family protein N-acetyltransferase
MSVTLRPATFDDCARLHQWRNDPDTRAASLSEEPVPLDAHVNWLQKTLQRDDCRLYVAQDDATGAPVGTCRLDKLTPQPGEQPLVELSLTVAPAHRGRGYAQQIINAAIAAAATTSAFHDARAVRAIVKRANERSMRAFSACGFAPATVEDGSVILERPL